MPWNTCHDAAKVKVLWSNFFSDRAQRTNKRKGDKAGIMSCELLGSNNRAKAGQIPLSPRVMSLQALHRFLGHRFALNEMIAHGQGARTM